MDKNQEVKKRLTAYDFSWNATVRLFSIKHIETRADKLDPFTSNKH